MDVFSSLEGYLVGLMYDDIMIYEGFLFSIKRKYVIIFKKKVCIVGRFGNYYFVNSFFLLEIIDFDFMCVIIKRWV